MATAPRPQHTPVLHSIEKAEPFPTTEAAWFWTISALIARQDGARIVAGRGTVIRSCEPDDVVKALDRLYRQRRIDLNHGRVLRRWGERGVSPNPGFATERADAALWREAMSRLEWPLRIKGIVDGGPLGTVSRLRP